MLTRALPRRVVRFLVLGLIAVVLIGGVYFVFGPKSTKTVSARFERAIGLYAGSDVRLHGVKIGSIAKVTPDGDGVIVKMNYDKKIKLPAYAHDAKVVRAAIIPPSLVSDRYVEFSDFSSCNGGCAVLASNSMIPVNQTASPVELDDIYAALDKLNVALGPQGANKSGATGKGPLSQLIDVGAANLQGNGQALGETVTNLSKAVQTLANGRGDLFGTVKNLQVFTDALVVNDTQVRKFNDQLDQVSGALADERQSLGEALQNLSAALKDIAGFIKNNGASLHTDIVGLKEVTTILTKQKAALNEILAVAPVALSNLVHTYNPTSGTLDTRANIGGLADPAVLCGILAKTGNLGSLSATLQQTCAKITKLLAGLPALGGVLDGLPGGSSVPGAAAGPKLPAIPGVTGQ